MVDTILKYGNETAFWNRMKAIGHAKRKNEDGSAVKVEKNAFLLMTPPLEDINGDKFLRVRMTADDADKLPPSNNPAFSIVWRNDEFDTSGEWPRLWDEPMPEVNTYDLDGAINGTRPQRVGTF